MVYGHADRIPIGTITNARYGECGVLTGDYDNQEDGYLDRANGWERCSATLSTDPNDAHFGERSLVVNLPAEPATLYGPTCNFRIEPGKDYCLSAWVKVRSGSQPIRMHGAYYTASGQTQKPFTNLTFYRSFSTPAASSSANEWRLVTLRIPASQDLTSQDWNAHLNLYVRIFVGCPAAGGTSGVQAAIDDIRFYPEGALVETVYYTALRKQPILTVDANNSPSPRTLYDGMGRPFEIRKMVADGSTILVKRFNYHLMREF